MNIYKKIITVFVSCIFAMHIQGQSNTVQISGTVWDAENNEPLAGASVYIKNTTRGASTDTKGTFILKHIPHGELEIVVSFVGFKSESRSLVLKPGESRHLDFNLQPEANSLHEIAVTAKSEARRIKEGAMPVTVINMASLQGTVTSISDILSKTVGMTIRTSGGIGSASRLSVRGLEGKRVGFFIDDIPMNDHSDFIDLNDIPVDMIERIEVYKGVVPARFGGSAMGGVVNIVIKEYPDRYMDVSYTRESFNSNKAQFVAKRNLKEPGLLFGIGGGYTYADNNYEMESPYKEGLKIKRNHDRFNKLMVGGSIKATKWWFDEVVFEPVFVQTSKQIQGIEADIREAETKSKAYLLANTLKKENFFLDGLDLDFSSAIAYTQINLIDTALYRYDWDGNQYPTPSKYGGELGNLYASNSNNKKITFINKLNLEYIINNNHSLNFNSVLSIANGYPKDSLRDLSLRHKSVFDAKMKSWVGGISYDLRLNDDIFLNSLTARYYVYSMNTKKSQIFGDGNVTDINLLKEDIGISNSMRYKFTRYFMAKLSAGYDVRVPSESELLGNGYSISPSEGLLPEHNSSVNFGVLYNKMGDASDNLQLEVNFFYMYLKNMIRFTKGFLDVQYQNFGETRTLGAELDVKLDIFPWLYGYMNITFQDLRDSRKYEENSEVPNPTRGKRMPNVPYIMSNAGMEFHHANLFGGREQNTRIFADASFIEEYYYDFEVTTNDKRRIPRSLTLDMGFEHSFLSNRLFLSGKVKNITDRPVISEFNLPLPGRSLGMKIRYIFK